MFDRERLTDLDAAPATATDSPHRLCQKSGCQGTAVATVASDYRHRIVAIGPASPYRAPEGMDLCQRHADRFNPPADWEIIRYDHAAGAPLGDDPVQP